MYQTITFVMRILIFMSYVTSVACQWYWTNEANFDNASRWSKNMTKPCAGQTVNFDSVKPTSVMIRESFTVGVLNLPNNGEIILSDNLIIGVDPTLSSCSDTEAVFWSSVPDSWTDPSNWRNADKKRLDFTPDEQTVPCQDSAVILPQETTFMIASDPGIMAESTSIKPWGAALTSSNSVEEYKKTAWGRYQIPGLAVDFSRSDCDATGCVCHKAQYQSAIMNKVCQSKVCDEVKCNDAFTPAGNCCPVCGAQIVLDYTDEFKFNDLAKFLDDQISDDYTDDTIQYKAYKHLKTQDTRSTSESEIVIVFSDLNGSESYAKTEAKKLSKSLKSFPGIAGVSIQYSGKAPGMSGGAIFGIVLVIIVVPALLGFVYIKRDELPSLAAFTSSFSNQNYRPRSTTSSDNDQNTDYGAFALSPVVTQAVPVSETSTDILPPRKKKKAPPPPPKKRVENPNYASTEDTTEHGVANSLFAETSTTEQMDPADF